MTVILGIDAAWTAGHPSGMALIKACSAGWRCLAVAPSGDSFLALAAGVPVDWSGSRSSGSTLDVARLLDAAHRLAGLPVDLVTIDMPVATEPITGHRHADIEISRAFGARGCSTHSPGEARPGPVGASLTKAFAREGFPVATSETEAGTLRRLVEVYPHPALLTLLKRPYRVPYKVAKAGRYLPGSSVQQRIEHLLGEFRAILEALTAVFGDCGLQLPSAAETEYLSHLKRYEDALDALVCAWVGVCYVERRADAFGNATAAIWCPTNAGGPGPAGEAPVQGAGS